MRNNDLYQFVYLKRSATRRIPYCILFTYTSTDYGAGDKCVTPGQICSSAMCPCWCMQCVTRSSIVDLVPSMTLRILTRSNSGMTEPEALTCVWRLCTACCIQWALWRALRKTSSDLLGFKARSLRDRASNEVRQSSKLDVVCNVISLSSLIYLIRWTW